MEQHVARQPHRMGATANTGFIAGGIIYEYVKQVFPEASILKLGMCYPLRRS